MTGTANLKAWAEVIVAVAVAVGLLAVLVATKPADANPRFRTVTKTFNNFSAITMPTSGTPGTRAPASPYPSQVAASNLRNGKILDVSVTLRNFSHTFPDDVDMLLVGPRGQDATIMSDVGGAAAVNNITLVLDDEAASSLPDNSQLVSGSFRPTNVTDAVVDLFPGAPAPSGAVPLSIFNGTNPNGTWRLYVIDDAAVSHGGQFAGGWSLEIKAKVRV